MVSVTNFADTQAIFFVEEQVDTADDDPYSDDTQPVYDWVPLNAEWDYVDGEVVYDDDEAEVPVRAEQREGDYISEVYGSFDEEVYQLYAPPLSIGEVIEETETDADGNEVVVDRSYELGVEANDRVTLGVTDGQFSLQPPNEKRLGSTIPKHVEIEVTRVSE